MTLIGSPRRGLRRREQFPARSCCPVCRPVLSRAVAGGPGHQTVHSLSVARGPRQPVRTLSGAGVQGCLFALKPLRGVQGGGVVFAALTCQFTHLLPRRVRAFLFSHSLSRGGPRGNYSLLVSCLHKGTSATESFRGSVCVAAVLSRGPVITSTTTSKGTPAPSFSPAWRQRVPVWILNPIQHNYADS